jgi:hypothetical protein
LLRQLRKFLWAEESSPPKYLARRTPETGQQFLKKISKVATSRSDTKSGPVDFQRQEKNYARLPDLLNSQ